MSKRLFHVGLVFLAAVLLVAFGYPWFKNFRHKLHDEDRISGCMANMGYVKNQLLEHTRQLSPDTPVATAIHNLIQSGQVDSGRLSCRCSGQEFRFRGRVGWLHDSAGGHGREIVAFEPVSSHHPAVPVLVLYASGDSDLIQQDELRRLLGDDAAESIESIKTTARRYVAEWQKMGMWPPKEKECEFFGQNLSEVRGILARSLSDSQHEVRMRGGYVIDKIGPPARAMSGIVIDSLKNEGHEFVRIYLINAIRSLGDNDNAILELLRKLFAEPTSDKEKLYIAAALFMLSEEAVERATAESFVCEYLAPYEQTGGRCTPSDYSDLRWSAVNAVEHMRGAARPIPLLEAMLSEPGAKPWIKAHVPRALKALRDAQSGSTNVSTDQPPSAGKEKDSG
ncbi:MAG: hypothetical protein KAV00_01085 [Phycisphaerae bacterium]|nr:hypothetical protein [Phycisphaerae bacterium]